MAIVGTANATVPSDPTVTSIVTEALKRGGRVNPTSTEITSGGTHQLQEVKSDIRQFAGLHKDLLATAVTTMTRGVSIYSWPSDARAVRTVTLLNSPVGDSWRGTAQTATSTTITFAATFDQDTLDVVGKWVVTTGGTGKNQYRQINAYDNSTKIATISGDGNWDTTPSGTILYMIVTDHKLLWQMDKATEWDRLRSPFGRGIPSAAAMVGLELNLNVAPDVDDSDVNPFVILWDYWFDVDRLDETGTSFVRIMREWRSLWIQGIAVKTMQRYDDDRYNLELQVYDRMLAALSGQAADVRQVQYRNL